jgi:hypothetical protein
MNRRFSLAACLLITACKPHESSPNPASTSAAAKASAAPSVARSAGGGCADFQALVASTYNVRPAKLEGEARKQKNAQLDEFDKQVRANKAAWLPCLRTALSDPKSDGYFRFDGSDLLLRLDSSSEAKAIRLKALQDVDLEDVQLRLWLESLAHLGYEGLDTSAAASRWFTLANPTYNEPEHAQMMGPTMGALVLFGSMDEAFATPALARVARDPKTPWAGPAAVDLLAALHVPAADAELQRLGGEKVATAAQAAAAYQSLKSGKGQVTRRPQPRVTRERFLKALNDLVAGKEEEFSAINREVSDAEKDMVAVLKPEDVALVRKVRRLFAMRDTRRTANLHQEFSAILFTLVGPAR